MSVWPYKPLDGMLESMEWATDVFRAKSGEQRICLRKEPRRVFNMEHVLTDYEYSGAINLIRQNQGLNTFQVPDWGQSQNIGSVSAGSTVYITVDLTYTDIGTLGFLWESVDNFEVVTIGVDSTGYYMDTVSGNYTSAKFMPAWEAVSPSGLSAQRIGARLNTCSIELTTTENNDLSDSDYDQYLGIDVIPSCPIIGSLDESIVYPVTEFDNLQTAPYYLRQRSVPDWQFSMSWTETSRAAIYELRAWLHSRRGRQKAFWYSTFSKDFELATNPAGTTLNVFALPGVSGIGYDSAFYIEIKETGGTSNYRQVVSASPGSTVSGRPTIDLNIDAPFTSSSVDRISYLRCARFDSDRIEFSHRAPGYVMARAPCIEIPVP